MTAQLVLYDAGTEEDAAPGTGPNQKPVQDPTAVNAGPDENENVQPVSQAATNNFDYPAASEVIQVTLAHDGGTQFTVTVENVSEPGTIDSERAGGSVPLSPFAWAVHEGATPFALFQVGEPASNGIELIAEDGFPANMIGTMNLPPDAGLADAVAEQRGLIVPLSPPVFAVHDTGFQAFATGQPAPAGIELVAEDGFPAGELGGTDLPPDAGLVETLRSEVAVRVAGAAPNPDGAVPALEPAPGGDGEAVEFTVEAAPGDRLSLFIMFAQTNDLFYAFAPAGVPLFDQDGTALSGSLTGRVVLYDAGTEVDEEPGVGPTQKPRQGPTAVNAGPDEGENVSRIGSAPTNDFSYPPANSVIRVTITPQQ